MEINAFTDLIPKWFEPSGEDWRKLFDGRATYSTLTSRVQLAILITYFHQLSNGKRHPLRMKLRLYEAAVVSLLTYGSETWFLNPRACRKLRGANSRMLAWITGNSIPHEARPATTSFNIIRKIRIRRLRWVGHILRAGPQNPSYQALKSLHSNPIPGSLLTDVPTKNTIEEVAILAKDRAAWSELIHNIPASN